MDEPLAIAPLWLEYSGLPAWLEGNVRTGAWAVFKKLVELDCQRNAIPDIVEASAVELAEWTGVKPEAVAKILDKLRQKKFIALYQAEDPAEPALIQIQVPLKTPRHASEVLSGSGKPFFRPGMRLRYAYPIDEPPGGEERLQQVVDLYLNNISMKVNSFIVDELRLVARRFALETIRKVFSRAAMSGAPELRWAVRQLVIESRETTERRDDHA